MTSRMLRTSVALCVTATMTTFALTGVAESEPAVPLNPCADSDNGDPLVTNIAVRHLVDVTHRPRRLPVTVSVKDTGGPGPARGVSAVSVAAALRSSGVSRATELRRASGDAWTGSLTIPRGAGLSGWMQLTVSVRDHAGRWKLWHPWDLRDNGLRHRFLVRDDGRLDTAHPLLLGVTRTPSRLDTRDGPGVVRFRVRVRDDLAGVDQVTVLRADGRNGLRLVRGTPKDGTWAGVWRVGRWVGPGPRDLRIGVTDLAGNGHVWSTERLADLSLEHRVVIDALADRSAPTVNVSTSPPSTIEARGTPLAIPVRVRAADPESGLTTVAVRLVGPHGRTPLSSLRLAEATRQDGTWAGDLVVPVCTPDEGPYLLQVTAVDRAGRRSRTTDGANTIQIEGADTTPPSSQHDMSRPAPQPLDFSEDVTGVSSSSATVTTGFGARSAEVVGVWTCRDAAAAPVDCLAGPVRHAAFHPTAPLVADAYVVVLDPAHVLDIRDAAGNPVPRTRLSLGTPDVGDLSGR
jgi:hypothetical protein